MLQGIGMAPGQYSAGFLPSQALGSIGTTMQQQGQNQLNAQYGQFQEAQNWPFKIVGLIHVADKKSGAW